MFSGADSVRPPRRTRRSGRHGSTDPERSGLSAPAVAGDQSGAHRRESAGVEGGGFATHAALMHPEHAGDVGIAGPASPVPRTCADRKVFGATGMLLARQLHRQDGSSRLGRDDEHGTVFAAAVAFLVRNPRPDDLAGVGVSVGLGPVRRSDAPDPARVDLDGGGRARAAGLGAGFRRGFRRRRGFSARSQRVRERAQKSHR